jgi:6-phosphogluconolactonase/glucosamine-6-phosphate isomerase/deaminase
MQTIHFLLPLNATKAPAKSLAITPRLIKSAKSVFLLATGVEKGAVLASGLTKLENVGNTSGTFGFEYLLDS